jgi:hypothetical protein
LAIIGVPCQGCIRVIVRIVFYSHPETIFLRAARSFGGKLAAAAEGVKIWEQTGAIAGMFLEGAVQSDAVKLKWFHHRAKARAYAWPKKSSGQAPIQKIFGGDQFTDAASAMPSPCGTGSR